MKGNLIPFFILRFDNNSVLMSSLFESELLFGPLVGVARGLWFVLLSLQLDSSLEFLGEQHFFWLVEKVLVEKRFREVPSAKHL
jgi:hypothetical protein